MSIQLAHLFFGMTIVSGVAWVMLIRYEKKNSAAAVAVFFIIALSGLALYGLTDNAITL